MISAANRPKIRCAWCGPSLLVVDTDGTCGTEPLTGYYFRETRYLRTLRLEISGEVPFLCAVSGSDPRELALVLIHPELRRFGGGGSGLSGQEGTEMWEGGLPPRSINIQLRYRVKPNALEARLTLSNHSRQDLDFELAWVLSADYADLQEAQASDREEAAGVDVLPESRGVRFRYAHPQLPLETNVTVTGPGAWAHADGRLSARILLPAQGSEEIVLRVSALDPTDPMGNAAAETRERHLEAWYGSLTRLLSPGSELLPTISNQAIRDVGSFALLEGEEEEWLAPAAGVPLYPALFGRDSLVAAWQASMLDQGQLMEASLTRLERLQGHHLDPVRDEERGRIIQQARRGPLARLGSNPFDRYYGDYASPFDFLIALGQLYAWTGDRSRVERHWDAARRILGWAREYGDRDGDGYLEYQTLSPYGPEHQGWNDSGGAIVYGDGRDVPSPVAVCEVQGYYYVAQQFMAVLSLAMGERRSALDLWRSAAALKERFNRDFWLEEEGFVALALDPDKQPVRTPSSNAGQCLATGIVSDEHVPWLVRRLFQPDLFNGWGIGTLSSRHPAYNPLSYHLGSVWPVENATIVFGLRRYGFDDRALELSRALLNLALVFPDYRIPECVGGFAREEFPHPGTYPQANGPQLWNQSAFPLVVQSILGLYPVAPLDLLLVHPILPAWLPELVVRNLRVGGAMVSLRFHRYLDGTSHVETLEKQGTLRILRQPPIDSVSVGIWDRLGILIREMLPF